jgi:hypothetical protein
MLQEGYVKVVDGPSKQEYFSEEITGIVTENVGAVTNPYREH